MANPLETWSWIAAIIAVPVTVVLAVVGWFIAAKQKNNKSAASADGIAISGDVHSGNAGVATGHHSLVSLNITLGGEAREKNPSLRS